MSADKQQRYDLEDQIEDVDHKDGETDQTDRIRETALRPVPDELQHRIAVGVPQKHEVLVEYRIHDIHDSHKHKDLGDGCQDAQVIERDLVADKAGNDIGDDQSVEEELVDRIEVPERKRGSRREDDGHDGCRKEQYQKHLQEERIVVPDRIQDDEVGAETADFQRQIVGKLYVGSGQDEHL